MAKSKQSQVRNVRNKGGTIDISALFSPPHLYISPLSRHEAEAQLQPHCNGKGNYSSVQDLICLKAAQKQVQDKYNNNNKNNNKPGQPSSHLPGENFIGSVPKMCL